MALIEVEKLKGDLAGNAVRDRSPIRFKDDLSSLQLSFNINEPHEPVHSHAGSEFFLKGSAKKYIVCQLNHGLDFR